MDPKIKETTLGIMEALMESKTKSLDITGADKEPTIESDTKASWNIYRDIIVKTGGTGRFDRTKHVGCFKFKVTVEMVEYESYEE
jgi:hypothetical protein